MAEDDFEAVRLRSACKLLREEDGTMLTAVQPKETINFEAAC